ncbi:hypothetical protein Q5M85_03915 [Paraclostridium bifermentans]|nr:hypothetical protein [Paraclostridium bifermentans]
MYQQATALSSIDKNGREEGLKAGGNVIIMPNLSPMSVREKILFYMIIKHIY